MAERSQIKIESLGAFDVDWGLLKTGLKTQGKAVEALARRLVSRKAVSQAGEMPGKRSGRLQKTIKSKMFRNGMGVYITHQLKSNEDRYPFMLAYGTPRLKARDDHIGKAFTVRHSPIVAMIRSTTKKAVNVKQVRV